MDQRIFPGPHFPILKFQIILTKFFPNLICNFLAYGKRIIRLPVTDVFTEIDADMHQKVDSDVVFFSQNVEFRIMYIVQTFSALLV